MKKYTTDQILNLANYLNKDVFETCDGLVIDNDIDDFTEWDFLSHAHEIAIKLKLSTVVSDWANTVTVSDSYSGCFSSAIYSESTFESVWNQCVIDVCFQLLEKGGAV